MPIQSSVSSALASASALLPIPTAYEDAARRSAVSNVCLGQLATLYAIFETTNDDWRIDQLKATHTMYTNAPIDGHTPPYAGETLSNAADRTLLQADDQLNLLIRDFLPSPVDFDAMTPAEAAEHIEHVAVILACMALAYRSGEPFDDSEILTAVNQALSELSVLALAAAYEELSS